MTFQQELSSWLSPTSLDTSAVPSINSPAPSSDQLPLPPANGKPSIITFLRHCGCPFAEKTLLALRHRAARDTAQTYNYIAVSHSSPSATQHWLSSLPASASAGAEAVQVIVDETRALHAAWGLGVSSAWHVLNPWSLYAVYALGRQEGIWNRPTESGSRWQTAGSFAVDARGLLRWAAVSKAADDVPDFRDALEALEGPGEGEGEKEGTRTD